MKTTFTLIVSVFLSILATCDSFGQSTYSVSSNTSWASVVPGGGSCYTCTFNITPGKTFTLNASITCGSCVFNGGTLVFSSGVTCQGCIFKSDTVYVNNVNMNMQVNSTSTSTILSNSVWKVSGSSLLNFTGPVALTNSIVDMLNQSEFFDNGGSYTSNNSALYLNDTSYILANSGPVSLTNNSVIVAGNGNISSGAYVKMNGANLSLDNSSMVKISNSNNYYYNYSNFTGNGTSYSSAYSYSSGTAINCGTPAYPNACKPAVTFGCATLNRSGLLACTPLALVDINLTAVAGNAGTVDLSWTDGQTSGIDHFTIQRSTDGQDWSSIADVAYKGYSNTATDYSYTDYTPLNGTSYYRLVIVNQDGRSDYTKIVPITIRTAAASNFSIFPNPVTNQVIHLNSLSTEEVILNVYNIAGQLLWRTNLNGQTQYLVNLPSAVPHNQMILIQLIGASKTQTFKVLNQ